MNRIKIVVKRLHYSLLSIFIITCVLYSAPLMANEESLFREEIKYYLLMKKEDFLETMIPKEKYLLGVVRSVNKEMDERRREGIPVSEMGIGEIISPDEILIDEYIREMQQIMDLLEEINHLERKAKQKVNLEVLEALSNLRTYVQDVIREGIPSPSGLLESANALEDSKTDSVSELLSYQLEATDPRSSSGGETDPEDLFEQWKYIRILDYKVKLTEYEFLRTRLLHTAIPLQEKRMFQQDLKRALATYSSGDFRLSRMQLKDILDTYTRYQYLDDVLYYYSESCYGLNYFDEAIEGYSRVIREYPQSVYSAKALVKMIYIYYIYGELEKLDLTYQKLLAYKHQLEMETLSTVLYLVGYGYFKSGEYEKGVDTLDKVTPGTSYFYPSLYLLAACCSNLGRDDLAVSTYHILIKEKAKSRKDPVLAQIRNNALLKLGLIHYELGENQKAIEYFNQVGQDFQYYDLSVMGKAWSAYRSGRPGEALRNVEWILSNAMISNYAYEAMVLAASSKDLLGEREEAIADLKQVYRIGNREDKDKKNSDPWELLQDFQEVERSLVGAFDERDYEMFAELEKIRRFLSSSIGSYPIEGSEKGNSTDQISKQKQKVIKQIDILDRFEKQAEENDNRSLIQRIRRLRSNFIQVLQNQTEQLSQNLYDPEDSPLLRRMGIAEYLKYIFRSLLLQTIREKEQTKTNIKEAENLLKEANEQDMFEIAIRMEVRKEELEDYYGTLNLYEVWIRENFPQEFRVELDRWASFSGYGVSNINFSRIKETDTRIAQISQTIDDLDRVFNSKRKNLDNRIENLLSDVARIEEQMHQEAEKKEKRERDRFFRSQYFNKLQQEAAVGRLRENPESKEQLK